MKNAKRLNKLVLSAHLDDIAHALHRQAIAAERCQKLYERSLELQEQSLRLQTKSTNAAQVVARVSTDNYTRRLLKSTQQATMMDEAP